MRVETGSFTMNPEVAQRRRAQEKAEAKNEKQGQIYTVNAAELGISSDLVTMKKAQAQKQAMKIVGDVFEQQLAMDDEMKSRNEHIRELQVQMGEAEKYAAKIDDDIAAIKEELGLSDEEALMNEDIKDLMARGDMFRVEAERAKGGMEAENNEISSIHQQMLKSEPMTKAVKTADNILDAASKEVLGLLKAEGKEHIDQVADEEEKKAQDQSEKEAEEKEKLDAARKQKEQQEALASNIREDVADSKNTENVDTIESDGMGDFAGAVKRAQQEVKNMVQEMKLLMEDVKGAQVDEEL